MPVKKTAKKTVKKTKAIKQTAKPFNLILLGDPGAGKATQGLMLAEQYHLFDLDMGRELVLDRERNKAHDAIHKKITDKGKLTPTKIVRDIFKRLLETVPEKKGILFNGTPKMLGEAKMVAGILKRKGRRDPLVMYISIPESETIKRISKRKGYSNTKFKKRPDDTIAGLQNRFRYYQKNIKEVLKYFGTRYELVHVNGMGSRGEVHKRLEKEIKKFLHQK